MARLMIVDDDAIIRKGLSKNIDWEAHGFELVGTASDGEEAYQLFRETQPELVISDIKMPFMNGLTLARQILNDIPQTKIILLTGYEEFEYAKQALELKVFEYILKPVEYSCLLQSAERAVRELQNEHEVARRVQESLPLLQQRFLNQLIRGHFCSKEEALKEAAFIKLDLARNFYIVVVAKLDDFSNIHVFKNVTEQEITKLTVGELSRRYFPSGMVFDPGEDELVILVGSNGDSAFLLEQVVEYCAHFRDVVNAQYQLSITIGIGTVGDGLIQAAGSYRAAKTATEFRHIIGKNQVLSFADTGMPVTGEPMAFPELEQRLGMKIKTGLTAEALEIVSEVEQTILGRRFIPLLTARLIGLQLAMIIFREMEFWEEAEDGVAKNSLFSDALHRIQDGQTVAEIFDEIRQIVVEITGVINRKRQSGHSGLIADAIQYIDTHFANEALSLSEVAQAVHVSPVYLSIIFKKERNINFSDYLTEIRMNHAMKMLRQSDLKTYEIAERVGFSNPQYFSVCFKKFTGNSPSEFRKR